jgi:hypothetical protein
MFSKIEESTNGKFQGSDPFDGIARVGLTVPGMVCPFCGKGRINWESKSRVIPGISQREFPATFLCFSCLTIFAGAYPGKSAESWRQRGHLSFNLYRLP